MWTEVKYFRLPRRQQFWSVKHFRINVESHAAEAFPPNLIPVYTVCIYPCRSVIRDVCGAHSILYIYNNTFCNASPTSRLLVQLLVQHFPSDKEGEEDEQSPIAGIRLLEADLTSISDTTWSHNRSRCGRELQVNIVNGI